MPPKFSIAQPRLHQAHGLSYRQLECLAWAHEGKSANDIGAILGISGRTVEKHLSRACETLGVRSRIQAVVRARDLGVLVISCLEAPREARAIASPAPGEASECAASTTSAHRQDQEARSRA